MVTEKEVTKKKRKKKETVSCSLSASLKRITKTKKMTAIWVYKKKLSYIDCIRGMLFKS